MRRVSSKNFVYMMSPKNKHILAVKPGESIVFETEDGFGGIIKHDEDPFPIIDLDHINQTTGPVYVVGAEPGDTLIVKVKHIVLPRQGVTTILPGFGVLHEEFNQNWKRVCPIRNGKVMFPKQIKLPVRPVIGTMGVSPEVETVGNLYPGTHGGNLDVKDITVGAKIFFPVFVPGALFSLGDGKAVMGDGETNGVGIEVAMKVTITFGLLKGASITRPRLENSTHVMTIASSKTVEEASKLALRDMLTLLTNETTLSREEAYALLGAIADVKIANLVDPEITVRVSVPRYVLKQAKRKLR
ncbi:MAG: acetamidase/formamidase family protein [Candidatus Bathyarchaeia archaeon]